LLQLSEWIQFALNFSSGFCLSFEYSKITFRSRILMPLSGGQEDREICRAPGSASLESVHNKSSKCVLLSQIQGGDVMGGTCSTYAGNESYVEMYVIKYGGKRQFRRRRIILKFMPILDDRM
jgi:hypothetical protein